MTLLLSWIWSSLSWMARRLARRGWLDSTKLPVRVVSVGNLQAGGAGKTPLVAKLAREAVSRRLRVCILTRGYAGEWERSGGVILPGADPVDARDCGDEAALLHERVPEAVIGVGADRVASFHRVVQAMGGQLPDLVVLDDGFQHWKIRKDIEVLAVTSAGPGQKPFRDFPSEAREASLVVWTKGESNPRLPVQELARVRYRLDPAIARGAVWLVTGLADGDEAKRAIEAEGFRVVRHVKYPDHARYTEGPVQGLLQTASLAGCQVALTGKDWVKWKALGVSSNQVVILEPELELIEGKELWDRVLWGSSS